MDFLGMGTGELLLVLFIMLLVFGPDKLPGMARRLGRIVHQLKQASDDFTQQVTKEAEAVEAAKKDALQQVKAETADIVPVLKESDPRRIAADAAAEARTTPAGAAQPIKSGMSELTSTLRELDLRNIVEEEDRAARERGAKPT